MLYLDDGIPVNSATFESEETGFELIRTAARTFPYAPVEFPKLQAPNCAKGINVEEIADVELDCTGTYPLA